MQESKQEITKESKNFYGILIYNPDYYELCEKKFDFNEFDNLIKKMLCMDSLTFSKPTRYGYRSINKIGRQPFLVRELLNYPILWQSFVECLADADDNDIFKYDVNMNLKKGEKKKVLGINHIKNGMQMRLLTIMRIIQRYYAIDIIKENFSQVRNYPWKPQKNENDVIVIE